jgi:hypothetical protein
MVSKRNYPDFLTLPTLPSLPPLEPLRFPRFQDLVAADREMILATKPTVKDQGAFTAFLGDPKILLDAWVTNPDVFDPALGELLIALVTGQKKLEGLSPAEMAVLNTATVEFAQYRPPAPAPKPAELRPDPFAGLEQAADEEDEREIEWNDRRGGGGAAPAAAAAMVPPAPTDSLDVTKVPTRWWERGRQ